MANTVADLQVVISADTSEVESALRATSQQVASFGESVREGVGLGVGMSALTAGIQAIGAGFGMLKSSVIDFNQQLDQSRAIFTRYFQGNQATADAFLNTLKQFAATTPFEFKDLSTFAVRLQNANTNANDIIPTLKAIGNAASATGNLSTESVDRITLALTQMQMKGKVSGEEMLQLTEANVPAWNILAEATGKPVAQLQKMASQGEITADVFIDAFRGMYENAGLMEGASKTLAGALSNIRDAGTQAFADIGRSIFDLATTGANAFASFLSSDDFQTWVQAAKLGVDALVASFSGLLSALAPVGEALAVAFHQVTTGDFAGAFDTISTAIQNALSTALSAITGFVGQMFGAGTELVDSFASGMLSAAGSVLQDAVTIVADTIAGFLIGASPPPKGPLSEIEQGGANTIEAWGKGAASAADAAVEPATQAIKAQIDGLKDASRDVDAQIREIGGSLRDVERAARDVKYAQDDIKASYDEQIKALDEQIKSVTTIVDAERDREQLNLNLQEIQLRQAEIAALGDREARARLQTQLDALKASDAERKNREALADASKALAGSEKDRLKAQLDAQKAAQEEKDLRARLKSAKPEDRARIQQQLKELATRKQIAAVEAQERAEADKRRLEDAQARQAQLQLQEQLNGLVDKEALARIKAQQDDVKARKEELSLAEQAAKLQAEATAAPLKAEKERLAHEREALLKPLNEQLETLTKQKDQLGAQRQDLQQIKSDIAANTAQLKEQVGSLKEGAKVAKDAAKDAGRGGAAALPTRALDRTFTPDAVAEAAISRTKEAGAKLASNLRDGFVGYFVNNPMLSGATIAGILLGAGHGASLGASLGSVVPVIGTAIGGVIGAGVGAALGGAAGAAIGKLISDGLADILGTSVSDAFAQFQGRMQAAFATGGLGAVAEALLSSLVSGLERLVPDVLNELQGLLDAIIDFIEKNARPLGDALADWERAFLQWVQTGLPKLLDRLADLLGQVLDWAGRSTTRIAGKLLDWATAFVQWLGPAIPQLLTELGKALVAIVNWIGTHTGQVLDALGRWALEFVAWVAPKIPPLLAELGALLVELTTWIATVALPAIVEQLVEWGVAIVAWVAPRIPLLLDAVGDLLIQLLRWFATDALPKIAQAAFELGEKLVRSLWDGMLNLWEQAGGNSLKSWLEGFGGLVFTAVETYGGGALNWLVQTGTDVLQGLKNGWDALWTGAAGVYQWLQNFGATVVEAVRSYVGGPLEWLVQTGTDTLKGFQDGLDALWRSDTYTWLTGIGRSVVDAVKQYAGGPLQWLVDVGKDVISGLQQGITGAWGSFTEEFQKQINEHVPETLKSVLGIKSPSTVMMEIGRQIVEGLLLGMEKRWPSKDELWERFGSSLSGISGPVPGDLDDWLKAAMAITGVGDDWLTGLRWLAMNESGGDPKNRNPVGVGPGGSGEHAEGLMQTIPSTFQSYRDKDLPNDITNPVSNAVAAINYIKSRYKHVNNAVSGWKERGGYATGGWAGLHGPELAWLGERGPEYVIPHDVIASRRASSVQTYRVEIALGGRIAEQIYITGRDLALQRGRA